MKKNQSGFSIIEALLIFVIVAIIGGTGWYVLRSKQNADKLTSTTSSTSQKSNWKTYSDPKYHLKFSYPSSWVVMTSDDKSHGAFANRSDVTTFHSLIVEKQASDITAPNSRYTIYVLNDSVDDMVKVAKNNLLNNGGAIDFKTSSEVIRGKTATVLTASVNGKIVAQDVYISSAGLTYAFDSETAVSHANISDLIPSHIIKSLTVTN